MKLDEILEEWSKDCKIDKSQLDYESLTHKQELHNKYLKLLTIKRALLKKKKSEYYPLLNNRTEYYQGTISDEDLKQNGWEPNPLKILRQDIDRYLNADPLLIPKVLEIGLLEDAIKLLEEIVKSINGRNWDIRNAIEFMRFTNGLN